MLVRKKLFIKLSNFLFGHVAGDLGAIRGRGRTFFCGEQHVWQRALQGEVTSYLLLCCRVPPSTSSCTPVWSKAALSAISSVDRCWLAQVSVLFFVIGPFSWSCTYTITTWYMSNKMDKIIVGMFVCLWNTYRCGLLQQTKETLPKFLTLAYIHVIVWRCWLTCVHILQARS
jgi:hypothetical protein